MRAPLLVSGLGAAVFLAVSAFVALTPASSSGSNAITNGDFENGNVSWNAIGGNLTQVDDPIHGAGDHAGELTLTNPSVSFVTQSVDLQPGSSYTLSGSYLSTGAALTEMRFLISWIEPGDALPQEVSTLNLPPSDGTSWEGAALEVDLPCDATGPQVRVYVRGPVDATLLLDDLVLKPIGVHDSCATDTPTPTATGTPTATSTSTATATPTATATGTPTATETATATGTLTATQTASSTGSPTATRTPTATPVASETATTTKTPAPTSTSTAAPTSTPPPTATATSPPTATRQPTATPPPTATVVPTDPPAPVVPAGEMLANGGFESAGEDGAPAVWRSQGGLLSRVAGPARAGSFAGAFFSSTSSTKWAYQTVGVTPLAWYEFESFVLHNDPWVESVFLRISWYASADGSGSALTTIDSTTLLDTASPDYRYLTTGAVRAPPGMHSANARVMMRPRGTTDAVIYIDDASFHAASPPSTPTSTATPFVPPTSTPTQPRAPTATPPASATATPPVATATDASPVDASPEPPPTPSHGLIVNGGFESAGDGEIYGWDAHGGRLTHVTRAHRGGFAALLASTTASTKWAFQVVAIEALRWYQLDAYVLHDDPNVELAYLRIAWYESEDGSGSTIGDAESTLELTSPDGDYRLLSTGPAQAPEDARSAHVRVLLRPRNGEAAAIVIDDVSLREVDPPPPEADGGEPASGSSSGRPRASGSGSTSSVLSSSVEPRSIIVQPTPVIRRSSLVEPAAEEADVVGGETNWPPFVLGATLACAAVAIVWASRRRGTGRTRG